MKKLRFVPFLAVLLSPGCFGGGGPTLVIENPPGEGKIDVQIVDSSLDKATVYAKVLISNHTDKIVVADRRLMILSDGTREWGPRATTRYRWQIGPHQTSSAVKLEYRDSDGTQPAYDLIFKPGAFRFDSNTGDEFEVPPLRLTVKKVAD